MDLDSAGSIDLGPDEKKAKIASKKAKKMFSVRVRGFFTGAWKSFTEV